MPLLLLGRLRVSARRRSDWPPPVRFVSEEQTRATVRTDDDGVRRVRTERSPKQTTHVHSCVLISSAYVHHAIRDDHRDVSGVATTDAEQAVAGRPHEKCGNPVRMEHVTNYWQ